MIKIYFGAKSNLYNKAMDTNFKRIPRRRKGIQYYFFNGIGMQMTYDMGTTSDIERYKLGNYLNNENARLVEQAIKELFKD